MMYRRVGANKYRKKNWFERHEMFTYTLLATGFWTAVILTVLFY